MEYHDKKRESNQMELTMERDIKISLPKAFELKMRELLESEYDAFASAYEKERTQGLRINTLKIGTEEAFARWGEGFGLKKIPWVQEGYFYDAAARPGKHSLHETGIYYIQEPSAMAVVELLDPQPGDWVLDLCAAPGGKSTHIAQRLQGQGFLLSNEIHPARVRILSQNIERMGVGNGVVTNEDSERLAARFPEFFDKILVDAPCSGEGMFRKEEGARLEWSPDHVIMCANRQQEILANAALMLKGGGRLVYSTCTFSPEENEGSIQRFLDTHPDFYVERVEAYEGFEPGCPEWISGGRQELALTYRIWPHKMEGEGHYLAVLKKEGFASNRKRPSPAYAKDKAVQKELANFMESELRDITPYISQWSGHLVLFGEQVYALPPAMPDYKGLRVQRPGLHLGTIKKNRFEPSHALALHINSRQAYQWYDMASESKEIGSYLRGETIEVSIKETYGQTLRGKGWVLMLADGCSIGWSKLVGTTLKNHYPKGLRKSGH